MGIALAVLTAFLLWAVWVFNRLVKKRNEIANARAQIEVQLSRRYELIPNLLKVAQRYMQHEQAVLEAVSQARAIALREPLAAVQGQQMAAALGHFFLRAEAYPALKADEQMLRLQEELRSTENRVAFARQYFNDAVNDYNDALQVFPDCLLARCFAFQSQEQLLLPPVPIKELVS